MLRKLFGGSKFLKKMNTLMEVYSVSHNTEATYRQLLSLQSLIHTEGEQSLFDLNRAALLYDMQKFRESADILLDIQPLNPEFDARLAEMKTKIMNAH